MQKSLGNLHSGSVKELGINIATLASGVNALKNANKESGFAKLSNNLKSLSSLNASGLKTSANGINDITTSLGGLKSVGGIDTSINNLVNGLSRLSKANVSQNLSKQSLEELGSGLASLQNKIASASAVDKNTTALVSSLSRLANAGQSAVITRQNLGKLGNGLLYIAQTLSTAPQVSSEMVTLTSAISQLANAGQKASLSASGLTQLTTQLQNLFTVLSNSPSINSSIVQSLSSISRLANSGSNISSTMSGLNNKVYSGTDIFKRLAQSGIDKANNALNKFSIFGKKASYTATTLASKIGLLYANFFMLFRAIKWVANAIDSAGDYIEAYNFFDVASTSIVEENGNWEEAGYDSAEAYVEGLESGLTELNAKMSGFTQDISNNGDFSLNMSGNQLLTNLGVNLTELTQFESEIISLGSSMGLTTSATFDMAEGLSMLSADMSSLHNMDLDTVMQNFESGLIGQSRALYKYGIDITNASLAETALNYGISKSVSEMTQAEKAQLRFLTILAQSKNSWGDLSNTVNKMVA